MLEDDDAMAELDDQERYKGLEVMAKAMAHQVDILNIHFEDLKQEHVRFTADLAEHERQQESEEFKIFRDYHQARMRRKQAEVDAGLYPDYHLSGDEEESVDKDELEAHADLLAYAKQL